MLRYPELLQMEIEPPQPSRYVKWQRAHIPARGEQPPFTVIGEAVAPANNTRSASLVMYLDNTGHVRFGYVQFFFTAHFYKGIHTTAVVRECRVRRDGRLLYEDSKGTLVMIRVRHIRELLGTVWKGDRKYLVGMDGPVYMAE
jgi:hypothetical protein